MKTPNHDVDSFIEALRGDLPSAEDETRVRSRLLAAGVVVTSAAVTTSGAAAIGAQAAGAASAPLVLVKAGLVSKLLVLPVAAKVGIATTLALAVAATSAPLIVSREEAPAQVAQVPSNGAPQPSSRTVTQPSPSNTPQVAPVSVQPAQPLAEQTPSTLERREPVRQSRNVAREPARAEPAPTQRARVSSLAEETRLMEQAMLAVGAGQHELARRSLDEHLRRFPDGLLARERERAVARLPRAGDEAREPSP